MVGEREALDLCIRVMKNVTYCFDSIEGELLNEKHPSCRMMLRDAIEQVEQVRDEESTG